MNPVELEIKDTTESNTSASYLALLRSIGSGIQLRTSTDNKLDDINIHITNMSSNIPSSSVYGVFISQLIQYAKTCSSNGCFILMATRLSNKLLEKVYVRERLKSSFRKLYVRYGDLIKQNEVLFHYHYCYIIFWRLTIYNGTLHRSDQTVNLLPNLTFYQIERGFHRAFATCVASQHGVLTPPGTLTRLIWDLHTLYVLRPILFPSLSWFSGLAL